jgi:phage shock protein E
MSKYRRPTQIIYALMVVLALWLIAPVMAGGGDPAIAENAWPMIQNGALLVDVRTEKEFADGHVDGAVNIEWDKTDDLIATIGDDKQRQVVFYCRSGNRAGKAKAAMEGKGYKHVFNATGFSALRATEPVN